MKKLKLNVYVKIVLAAIVFIFYLIFHQLVFAVNPLLAVVPYLLFAYLIKRLFFEKMKLPKFAVGYVLVSVAVFVLGLVAFYKPCDITGGKIPLASKCNCIGVKIPAPRSQLITDGSDITYCLGIVTRSGIAE